MSYNDSTDVESVLQQAATPPAATPTLTRTSVPFSVPADPVPSKIAAPPTAVGVPLPAGGLVGVTPVPLSTALSTKGPAQTQRAAASATAQLVPVAPTQPPVIAPLLQTPLNAAQTPATTQPGTVTQS